MGSTDRNLAQRLAGYLTLLLVVAALFAVGTRAHNSMPIVVDGGHVITQADCPDGTAWNHSNCPLCLRDDPGRFQQAAERLP